MRIGELRQENKVALDLIIKKAASNRGLTKLDKAFLSLRYLKYTRSIVLFKRNMALRKFSHSFLRPLTPQAGFEPASFP